MKSSGNGVQPVRLLLLDRRPSRTALTLDQLQQAKRAVFETTAVQTADEALQRLHGSTYDVLVIDISRSSDEAAGAIRAARRIAPPLPIFVIADEQDHSLSLEVVREGAEDCLPRNFINPRAVERAILNGIERKRVQCALQERDLRYRLLFNEVTLGMALFEIVLDENALPVDYRYLEINTAFERHTGHEGSKVLGRTAGEVRLDTDGSWIKACETAVRTGERVHFETYERALKKWFEVTAFRLGTGQVAVTFAEITERKSAEREVQRLGAADEEAVEMIVLAGAAGITRPVERAL